MILKDLLDLLSKEKRKREIIKTAQKFAVGIGVVATVGFRSSCCAGSSIK